jgi:hypothetical protein
MPNQDNQARVFISCGQQPHEMDIVRKIEGRLNEEGFVPYVAIRQHSVKGLRQNIFEKLASCEYFLFIDFKRERLEPSQKTSCGNVEFRGSLFVNQEFSIASFLEMEALGFQHEGIKREALLNLTSLNCDRFTDANTLPDLVMKRIKEGDWRPNWRAELSLTRSPDEYGGTVNDQPYLFHVVVENLHWRKPALDCRAYIHRVENLDNGKSIPFEKFELKWAGTKLPNVTIMPKEQRSFDAFSIWRDNLTKLKWKDFSFTDTEKICPEIEKAGKYLIEYLVTSLNFKPKIAAFELHLKESVNETRLSLIETESETLTTENLQGEPR